MSLASVVARPIEQASRMFLRRLQGKPIRSLGCPWLLGRQRLQSLERGESRIGQRHESSLAVHVGCQAYWFMKVGSFIASTLSTANVLDPERPQVTYKRCSTWRLVQDEQLIFNSITRLLLPFIKSGCLKADCGIAHSEDSFLPLTHRS